MEDKKNEPKITAGDAIRQGRITMGQFATAAGQGRIDPRKKYSPKELEDILNNTLDPLADHLDGKYSPPDVQEVSHLTPNTEVQIVYLKIPETNQTYLTLMKNGKVIISRDSTGRLMFDRSENKGLSNIYTILAGESLFDPAKRQPLKPEDDPGDENPNDDKNPNPPGDGPDDKDNNPPQDPDTKPTPPNDTPPDPTPEPPKVVIDAAFVEYFRNNAGALSHAHQSGTKLFETLRRIKGRDGLEQVLDDPEFLDKAETQRVVLEVEPVTSFLSREKRKIERIVKRNNTIIKDDPNIRPEALDMLDQYMPDGDLSILKRACDDSDFVFELYRGFENAAKRVGGNYQVQHFVIAFKEFVIETLMGSAQAGIIILGADELSRFSETTSKWVAYARAADFVKNDEFIQNEVIPGITESPDDVRNSDKVFNSVLKLAIRVFDSSQDYHSMNYRRAITGLWMEGLIDKIENGETKRRPSNSVYNAYCDGFGNLVERYSMYDPVLKSAFGRLLDEGQFDERMSDLQTSAGCVQFGTLLYDSIGSDQALFTHLDDDTTMLKPKGSSIRNLLRLYVGLNREYFMEKVGERRQFMEEE